MRKTITVPLRWQSSIRWRIGGGGGTGVLVVPPALVQLRLQLQARRPISNCAVRYTDKDNNGSKNGNAAATTTTTAERAMAQSQSPLGRVGVAAALAAAAAPGMDGKPKPTVWDEFALRDRVALVSGANRGLGLEMALVMVEAGARAVYCVDLPARAGDEWRAVAEYVRRMEWPVVEGGGAGGRGRGRLEYVCADVRDQKAMWRVGEEIGDREGRMDVCVAAAGILKAHRDCLEYPGEEFEEVRCPFPFFSFFLSLEGGGRGTCATDMVVKGSLILIVVHYFFVR